MKSISRQFILSLISAVVLIALTAATMSAQTPAQPAAQPPAAKGLMSDQAFKNIKVLKGIPVDEFMATMGFFSASLAENCLYCHVLESAGDWGKFAEDNDHKVTARRMIAMVNTINKNYFQGRREITCYSCHRGGQKPKITPNLAELYGPVPPDDTPDAMVKAAAKAALPDQVIDQYIQAIGGAQKVASITSFAEKGIYQGFADDRVPYEEYGKAPNLHTLIVHGEAGNTTTTFDGTMGWTAGPATERPIQVFDTTGGNLDGARLDGELFFPSRLKQVLSELRTLLPTTIDDKDVVLIQGTMNGKYPVNLYFDKDSHLLVRSLRFAESAVGPTPTQVDYADYRDVGGIKVPFKRTTYWLDGRTIAEVQDIRFNVNVDPKLFDKPAVPETKRVQK